jgi:hypothetical protein
MGGAIEVYKEHWDHTFELAPPSPLKLPPRSLTTTFAPLLPKNVAYAFPRPPPAPVTTTVWLSKRSSDITESSMV